MKVPLSSLPVWNDSATLREECSIRCCSEADQKKLKLCKTMEKMEGFFFFVSFPDMAMKAAICTDSTSSHRGTLGLGVGPVVGARWCHH